MKIRHNNYSLVSVQYDVAIFKTFAGSAAANDVTHGNDILVSPGVFEVQKEFDFPGRVAEQKKTVLVQGRLRRTVLNYNWNSLGQKAKITIPTPMMPLLTFCFRT